MRTDEELNEEPTVEEDPIQTSEDKSPFAALIDVERRHLEDLTKQPGWHVLQRVISGYKYSLRVQAQRISMNDPLNFKDEVANAWAYATAADRLHQALVGGILWEIEKLHKSRQKDSKQAEPMTEEEMKWHTLGMLEKPPQGGKKS